MVRAYVGLGSNQGDPRRQLDWGVRELKALPATEVTAASGVYRTEAVGHVDQPDFLNQVVALDTELSPRRLLEELQGIEQAAGRRRTIRWGPRTLDLDVLWYDEVVIEESDLQIPHPRMAERRFVLAPLAELAPRLVLPDGRTVDRALAEVHGQRVMRLADGAADEER